MHVRLAALCALLLGSTILVQAADVQKPDIWPRTKWGAVAAKPELMDKHPAGGFKSIVIHYTTTYFRRRVDKTNAQNIKGVQHGHMVADHQWGDIAYHYIITRDGTIAEARSLDFIGDSATVYDRSRLIMVVLDGNFQGGHVEKLPNGKTETWGPDTPTDAQKKSLVALVAWLAQEYTIDPATISGHREHVGTSCPGELLWRFLPELRERSAKALAGK
ncbi:MAG: peptidoglycan recognition protein family protein [Hyphomicrobium sp.]